MQPNHEPRRGHSPPTQQIPNVQLLRRLGAELETYTPSERAIASHILAHYSAIGYETAKSLAAKTGVSEITVGRFARKLNYRNLKALKNDLREGSIDALPWLIGDDLEKFVSPGPESGVLEVSLQREVQSLVDVFMLNKTELWTQAVTLLARSHRVHVAGFQTERGIAMLLVNHLQFMRDGVQLVDLTAGNYADIFASTETNKCLVVIDIRRYSRQSYLLAERASQERIPLIVFTDMFCDWAPKFTSLVIAVPTQAGMFWSSPVALVCAVNLMVNSVIKLIGPEVEKRLERLTRLHQAFTGYAGHHPTRPKFE